uniref:Uncharacterized protein n=1 Tax=Peronospora matthiolae TaxID=2874970 RepID=A0AAV1TIF9_9STRA
MFLHGFVPGLYKELRRPPLLLMKCPRANFVIVIDLRRELRAFIPLQLRSNRRRSSVDHGHQFRGKK